MHKISAKLYEVLATNLYINETYTGVYQCIYTQTYISITSYYEYINNHVKKYKVLGNIPSTLLTKYDFKKHENIYRV